MKADFVSLEFQVANNPEWLRAEVVLEVYDDAQKQVARYRKVFETGDSAHGDLFWMFRVAPDAAVYKLVFRLLSGEPPMTLCQPVLSWHEDVELKGRRPVGTISEVVGGHDEVVRVMTELKEYKEYYHDSAQKFAEIWNQTHNADALIVGLTHDD